MKINEQPPIKPTDLGQAVPPSGPARPRPEESIPADPGAAGRAGAPAARVELSMRSRELHEALRAANAAPDVREDVVADARTKLTNGTYRVDPERIARGILDTTA